MKKAIAAAVLVAILPVLSGCFATGSAIDSVNAGAAYFGTPQMDHKNPCKPGEFGGKCYTRLLLGK